MEKKKKKTTTYAYDTNTNEDQLRYIVILLIKGHLAITSNI